MEINCIEEPLLRSHSFSHSISIRSDCSLLQFPTMIASYCKAWWSFALLKRKIKVLLNFRAACKISHQLCVTSFFSHWMLVEITEISFRCILKMERNAIKMSKSHRETYFRIKKSIKWMRKIYIIINLHFITFFYSWLTCGAQMLVKIFKFPFCNEIKPCISIEFIIL